MGSFLFSLEISFAYFSSLLLSDVALSLFLHTAQRQFNPPSKGMTPRRWHRLFFFFFLFFFPLFFCVYTAGSKGALKSKPTRHKIVFFWSRRPVVHLTNWTPPFLGGGMTTSAEKKRKEKKNIFFYFSCLSGDAYLRPFYSLRSLISGDFEFQTGAPIQSGRKGTPLCWRTGTQRWDG